MTVWVTSGRVSVSPAAAMDGHGGGDAGHDGPGDAGGGERLRVISISAP
jgi:hypothetical protein